MTSLVHDPWVIEAHGARIPARGFGTWQLRDGACRAAVTAALDAGYRHIDTAALYANESEVGAAIRSSGVARDAVFLTTKVWTDDLREEDLLRSAQASLARFKMDQVDLLLIHWPNRAIPLESSISGLCRAKREGFARHIGVSNFPAALLRQASDLAIAQGDRLVVNQCEYHPLLDQTKLLEACRSLGMAFTAYSPLGLGDLIRHPAICEIAQRVGRFPAQVILRWHLQQGIAAVPRSATPSHIAANFNIADFSLDDSAMASLSGLSLSTGRLVSPSFAPDWD